MYLGLWVTQKGNWSMNKNVEAIVKIISQKKKIRVSEFIGLVNYYSYMCDRR